MKIVEREVMVPKKETVYVAFDGKEFKYEDACTDYELRCKENTILSPVEQCEELDNYPPPNGSGINENNTFHWYLPKTAEDMNILRNVFCDCSFSDEHIGEWHCVEDTPDFNATVTTEDEIKGYITDVFDKLGVKVNFIKKDDLSIKRLEMLLDELTEIGCVAPDVGECSDKDEKLFEDIATLRQELENFLEV